MYVTLRPYLYFFLDRIAPIYNLVLFTSATQEYAEEIRDLIDPERKYFKDVLSRKHCLETKNKVRTANQTLTKNLGIFKDVDLQNILIVDNSTSTFANNLGNGIPIVPFHGDSKDDELKALGDYLVKLSADDAVATSNLAYFNLHRLKHSSDMITGYSKILGDA